MISPLRASFFCSILALFGLGLYDVLVNFEEEQCELTLTPEAPEFLKVELNVTTRKRFPKYNLYFYGEGKYAKDAQRAKFRLSGIPVLFIPGNAGSHQQVKSLGSVAQSMAKTLHTNYRFNFYALDFNEELSALFGPVLPLQTEFAHECIRHILSLYGKKRSHRPETVLLIGHSMGGVVARALFSLPNFDRKLVHTILTQAAPHQTPVVLLDPYMVHFYETVNGYWSENGTVHMEDVSLVSVAGGYKDLLVRSGLTSLIGIGNTENSMSTSTMTIPRVWLSTHNMCHVWCKQIILATVRALFDAVDKTTKQIAINPTFRKNSFQYHFEKNVGPKYYKASYDLMIQLDPKVTWELRRRRSWKYVRESVEYEHYSVVELNKRIAPKFGFVAVTNVENVAWVGACTLKAKETRCAQVGNFARYANLLPPQGSNLKLSKALDELKKFSKKYKNVVHLDGDKLDMFTHWVALVPKSTTKMILMIDMYNTTKRHLLYNMTTLSSFFWSFPDKIGHEDVVLNGTKPRTLFYRIDLQGLEIPLQAFVANIVCKSCSPSNTSAEADYIIAKFVVPWTKDSSYTVIKRGEDGRVSLKLPTPKPEDFNGHAQLHLYVLPACSYQVKIGIAWQELLGQTVRFYGGFIPAYVVIQIMMALSWQLMMLDEQEMAPSFSFSHLRWAQPYRVVIAALGIRFIFSYPEKDNLMSKLGLPLDDIHELARQNIWYPALPVILYLVAYAFVVVFVQLLNLVIAAVARVLSVFCEGFLTSALFERLFLFWQYLVLGLGLLGSTLFCGSLGVIAANYVYLVKMFVNYIKVRKHSFSEQKVWTRFNIDFSLALLLLCSLILNLPSFLIWYRNLSWETMNLPVDPSLSNGVILCVSAVLLTFADFPVTKNEMLSIMGFISYLCAITLVLMATVSLFRISYFINATMMTIALPSVVISVSRARAAAKQKTE